MIGVLCTLARALKEGFVNIHKLPPIIIDTNKIFVKSTKSQENKVY
jgi:hypothetical protein